MNMCGVYNSERAVKRGTRQGNSSGQTTHAAGVYLTRAMLDVIEEDLGSQLEGQTKLSSQKKANETLQCASKPAGGLVATLKKGGGSGMCQALGQTGG